MRGRVSLLLVLICAACALCEGAPQEQEENRECSATGSVFASHSPKDIPDDWHRHIIRFSSYQPIEELHGAVREQLSHLRDWAILPRSNAAVKFPTDFALIASPDEQLASLTASLLSSPAIRDIHPDRTIRGLLKSEQTDIDVSRDYNVSLNAGESGSVEKRPGRLSTRWSIDTEQRLSDIVDELKHDAKVIQSRRGAHDRSQGRDEDPLMCKRASPCNGTDSTVPGTDRHLLPWGHLDSIDLDDEESWQAEGQRRQLLAGTNQVTTALGASKLWDQGFKGDGIRVGVFDTGIREGHPHIKKLKERSNWTHENTLSDELGHGTFVAGVISGSGTECPGFAPGVELYTFKVFTNDQVSFTSWFLDAFNYAIATKMQVVNLSIGGPDFLDRPFVDKVQEITASGVIMISAIGNDGPLYGTLNNPADQLDVIGVGGLDYSDHIASFSSRGMITWHLPTGFGGSKPDVMAYGREVKGSKIGSGCRSLSGTSVASPVVAGAVCLLASIVPEASRDELLNPASMKQALVEGAQRLSGLNIFEQGAGKIDLAASKNVLQNYSKPRASVVPASVDFTDCPYMWPYCSQPLYAGAQPIIFNATILNGMGVWGNVSQPVWLPGDEGGQHLDVQFEYSEELWPWSGHISLFVVVQESGRHFSGTATGTVRFTVESPPKLGTKESQLTTVDMPLKAAVVETPPRNRRVLWDQFHSIKYPPAYLPRDNLDVKTDILDWHGDHLLTNYHTLYTFLRENGMFVEILSSPYTCFNASQYAVLIVADSEEEFYAEEITKLSEDVATHGLGLLLFPEWYSQESMARMHFFDDNTRSWWVPVTGGSNIPAVNELVAPFGLAFGDKVLHGSVSIGKTHTLPYASGTQIIKAPAGARILDAPLQDRSNGTPSSTIKPDSYSVLGLVDHGKGRIAAFGDASCVDANHATTNCHGLLFEMLQWATDEAKPPWGSALTTLEEPLGQPDMALPTRPSPNWLDAVSFVANHPEPTCYLNSASGMQRAAGRKEPQEVPKVEAQPDPPPTQTNPVGQVRQPKFEATASSGTSESPSDYISKVAPIVLLLAIFGTGFVLWIWTRNRRATTKSRSDQHVQEDSNGDPAAVRGNSRGVSHRR